VMQQPCAQSDTQMGNKETSQRARNERGTRNAEAQRASSSGRVQRGTLFFLCHAMLCHGLENFMVVV
jgi:hypothetical protein